MNLNDVKRERNPVSRFIWSTVISSAIGIAVCFTLLLLFSLLLTFSGIPDGLIPLLSFVSIIVGAFVSGFMSSKKLRRQGIVNGLTCAAALLMCVFVFKLIFAGADSFTAKTFLSSLLTMLSSVVGGIVGINTKIKR